MRRVVMATPDWTRLLHDLWPVLCTLCAYVLGTARRKGAERASQKATHGDVSELKAARIEHGATLAAHTAILSKLGEDVVYIRSRLDAKR